MTPLTPDCSKCAHNQPYTVIGIDREAHKAYKEDRRGCAIAKAPGVCGAYKEVRG